MKVRVKLRFNKLTGEVEEFLVDDQDSQRLPEAEHNREHDRVAAAIGGVIERYPRVTEVAPGGPAPVQPAEPIVEPPQTNTRARERHRP